MPHRVLSYYGLNPASCKIELFGPGLINSTYKVSDEENSFILQKINSQIFKSPQDIAQNLAALKEYFAANHPGYLFVAPISGVSGELLVEECSGVYRLFPFVQDSQTISVITHEKQAFEAAKQFGQFTRLLKDFAPGQLAYTLADFHNLKLRFEQFEAAYKNAGKERLQQAEGEIEQVHRHQQIVELYNDIVARNELPLRVIHHDTKISNVLFDKQQNGLCVIDLDTVMPGYYLSDVGDMMRTYLSPVNEDETDLDKIFIRKDIFNAICRGYLSEMGTVLSETEKKYFLFSGKMMIYMQAIRFLTDFLNNDIYYDAAYPQHNLNRSRNQFQLLNQYCEAQGDFEQMINTVSKRLSI